MKKIPVKIIEFSDGSDTIREVMIDLADSMQLDGDPGKKLDKFKIRYFKLIHKAEKLFFDSDNKKSKIKNLSSLKCWELGNLFGRFDNDVKNNFTITNYAEALERDFGRSSRYIRELIAFSELFAKHEISNKIPMAIYRALVWKKTQLASAGILQQEKNRLIEMGKTGNCCGRERYKINLIDAINKSKKFTSV